MSCPSGSIRWIELAFNDCVVTARDRVSFGIGLISNILFLLSSIPQIVLTCRSRSVEGQSPWFFSLLFLGSTCSLLGAIITNGLVTQIIQSVFYVIMDGILLFQLIFFKYIVKKCCHSEDGDEASEAEEDGHEVRSEKDDIFGAPPAVLSVSAMSHFVEAKTDFSGPYSGSKLSGTVFAWVSTIIFVSSRLPQIVRNCRSKSFGDISAVWLVFSIVGNLTYFLSIIVRDVSGTYLWRQTPFIVGAVGPACLDIFLMVQMCLFRSISDASEDTSAHEENEKTASSS